MTAMLSAENMAVIQLLVLVPHQKHRFNNRSPQ